MKLFHVVVVMGAALPSVACGSSVETRPTSRGSESGAGGADGTTASGSGGAAGSGAAMTATDAGADATDDAPPNADASADASDSGACVVDQDCYPSGGCSCFDGQCVYGCIK